MLKLCGFSSGGVYSKSLVELIESGFVSQYTPFGEKNKDSLFRLTDEYSLFYLKFIEPNIGQGSGTWSNLFQKQTYKTWTGFVFETICLKHVQQIKKELGVENIYSVHSCWLIENAQIDLLIDRDDVRIEELKLMYQNKTTINTTALANGGSTFAEN